MTDAQKPPEADTGKFVATGNYVLAPVKYIYCGECEMDVRLPHGHLRGF